MKRLCLTIVCGLVLLVGLTLNLESVPPVWWDEGWTLSVARNWAEFGHYGRFLAGQSTERGMEAAFPLTGMVALSFRLFGIGIFQGRIVGVIFTLIALGFLYLLGKRFYSPPVGIVAVLVLLCLGARTEINPLIAGRQMVGEIPALLFLLTGYLCFWAAGERPWISMPAAVGLWTIALFCKVQVQPFLATAFVVPLIVALIRRQFQKSKLFAVCLIGSQIGFALLQYAADQISPSVSVSGLTPLMALIVVPQIRLFILSRVVEFGIPTFLGLSWALWEFWKNRNVHQKHSDYVRLSFFVLAGSWFGWYVILSIGWPRYMFPSVFLGSIFVAAMLSNWTNQFNLTWTSEHAAAMLKTRFNLQNLAALASILLVTVSVAKTIQILHTAHTVYADDSIKEVTRFLNTQTPPDALIETYESELFFLLDRRYHYPDDQMAVELLRYKILDEKPRIHYNPIASDPDYLVAGFQSTYWQLYDKQLESGEFRLIQSYPKYRVYQRLRKN